jgi:hypothetical protein
MKKLLVSVLAFSPALAFAQAPGNLQNVNSFLTSIGRLINTALPIVIGLALLGFFWGLAQFILKGADPAAQKSAKSMMIWSIVALFLMVSVWGLVNFLGSTLGVGAGSGNNPNQAPTVPTVPGL